MIPQEIIDQILDRVDIVEVISDYIQLKKTGRNFKACCPFHDEKTPSFVVSPDKQIYHCFGGCYAGGNVINFVMKYENMSFPEAVKVVAAKAGVQVPERQERSSQEASISSQLQKVNLLAAAFYQKFLMSARGKKALEYLNQRGIDEKTINRFKIGFAPNEWESFKRYCVGKKIPVALLRKAGLTVPSERGKGDYDRFRNRIIYPIFNERDHIVAFGGRVMDDSLPKYINSPETTIYSKSNVLYGLNFSKRGIRDKGYAVIVEGYMDVIMPFKFGINNVVATSGTALTSSQAVMLRRQADTAVIVFDSDQAGESASLRGLDILVENRMNVKIALLPKGEDPDSYVKKHGKEGFEKAVEAAKDLFDYKLDLLVSKLGENNIGGISDEMLPTIAKVQNAVVQSSYLKRLAEKLEVHESSLQYEMKKVKSDYSYRSNQETKTDITPRNYRKSELHLLGLGVVDKNMFDRIYSELGPDKFRDRTVRKIIDLLKDHYREIDEVNVEKLISRLGSDGDAVSVVVQALAMVEIAGDRCKALDDCMLCVVKEDREERLRTLMSKLKKAQEVNDNGEMKELLNRINKIHKEKVA